MNLYSPIRGRDAAMPLSAVSLTMQVCVLAFCVGTSHCFYAHPLTGVLPRDAADGVFDDSILFGGLFAFTGVALVADAVADGAAGSGSSLVATSGRVASFQKIDGVTGGLTGGLENLGFFGRNVVALGDVDGDGITDVAAGAWADDDGGLDCGAVWILFMNRDGTVKAQQVISFAPAGGFTGIIAGGDYFGYSLSALGDVDNDGVPDLAASVPKANDGGAFRGGLWVLLLNSNGTVKANQKISSTTGGFSGTLDNDDQFGTGISGVGDLDGDGVPDLVAGAIRDDDDGVDRGALWVLFLNANGTVKSHQKISPTTGGFTGTLITDDYFGTAIAKLGDLDGDGVPELAVGAEDDDGGVDRGAVWIVFLNSNGSAKNQTKISSTSGGFTGALDNIDYFEFPAGPGDLNGDGVPDLVVGGTGDDDGGTDRGAVWVLFLNADGTVRSHQKISSLEGNFSASLQNTDGFGNGIGTPGDLNGDLVPDLVVGVPFDDNGVASSNRGAFYVLFLEAAP